MKQTLLSILLMLLPLATNAETVEINGIYYNLVDKAKEAEVTSNPNRYSGEVIIPDKVNYSGVDYSVTSIGSMAFRLCNRLTSITIPNSVTSIGNSAFQGCSSLTSITIPNSVTTIENGAFGGCTGLSSMIIPNSVTILGRLAFYNCKGLTTVTLSNGIDILNMGLFQNCSDLTTISIPNSVTTISSSTFYGCSSLTSIDIPNSVTTIEASGFENCTGLTSISIGSGILNISNKAFASCQSLTDVYCYAENVPDTESNAFEGSYPEYITLHVPASVINSYKSSTPWSGFKDVVDINGGGTGDNNSAPSGTYEIGGVYYILVGKAKEAEVTSNPNRYSGEVVIPAKVNYSGVDYSVTSIGYEAFRLCNSLTSTTIPNSVTSIGERAFQGCSSLTSITIPNSVTTIENGAFAQCIGLSSVIIPNSVTILGRSAFNGCKGLTSVTLSNGIDILNPQLFYNCSDLTTISIPNSVTTISSSTFYGCSSLTSIDIPNSVTTIEASGFENCTGLTSISIGSGILNISNKAFASCQSLTDVYCNAEDVPYTESNAFEGSYPEYITLHVPASAVNSYKESAPWSGFKKVVAIGSTYTLTYKVDGQVYKTYELAVGEDITPEAAPTKEGNTFSGWSDIPDKMPAHDVTVTGTFSVNKYKLTYMVDGKEYKSYEIKYGSTITPEAEPTKEGYTFSGWSDIPQTMPDHDVTVTGTFTANKYKLTYVVDGETYKTYDVEYGASITPEAAPTKEGNTFSGWSEIPDKMPAHDVTVTGTFSVNKYKLTYLIDGKEYKSYEIKYGSTITPEAEPTKEGHTFSGWSDIPETMPAHDVTVTGTFTVNKYKLTYVVDGETYKSYDVEYGASITPEAQPTKDGCTFSGWSDIPQTMPAHDVTVTGTFNVSKYKLIYKVDGEVYKTYELKYGSTITPEAEPTKEGYTFSGWSDIPETMPAHDVTVTGTFSVNKYKLTYKVDDKEYKSYEVEYGASITPEAEPTKKGHTFSGWSNIPNTMPARDVTVTGSFTINKYKLTYLVDGDVYKSYDIRYGSTITPEAEPTKNGYKFSGWSDIPEEMPDYDVTVYGYFEKVYDVGDVVSLVNIIMNLTNASSEDISAYDMNHDNDLDIGDMILVIKEILRSQQTRVRGQEPEALTRAADPYVDLAQFTAAQFTVSVPAGCAVEDIRLTGSNRYTHALVWEQIEAGLYAVVVYSDSNLKFSPENGTILEVVLSDKNCTEIATGNVVLATPEGERVWLNALPAYAATTGIANVRSTEAFDVYDLSGRKVRSQSHSLEGISSGVYIINGKKTVIK